MPLLALVNYLTNPTGHMLTYIFLEATGMYTRKQRPNTRPKTQHPVYGNRTGAGTMNTLLRDTVCVKYERRKQNKEGNG